MSSLKTKIGLAGAALSLVSVLAVTTFAAPNKAGMEMCKDGGWKTATASAVTTSSSSATSSAFKNQGDCVSYFASGGKNLPSGQ